MTEQAMSKPCRSRKTNMSIEQIDLCSAANLKTLTTINADYSYTPNETYGIDDPYAGHQITAGVPGHLIRRLAQRIADERAQAVIYYRIPADDSDGVTVEPDIVES